MAAVSCGYSDGRCYRRSLGAGVRGEGVQGDTNLPPRCDRTPSLYDIHDVSSIRLLRRPTVGPNLPHLLEFEVTWLWSRDSATQWPADSYTSNWGSIAQRPCCNLVALGCLIYNIPQRRRKDILPGGGVN